MGESSADAIVVVLGNFFFLEAVEEFLLELLCVVEVWCVWEMVGESGMLIVSVAVVK